MPDDDDYDDDDSQGEMGGEGIESSVRWVKRTTECVIALGR